MKLEYIKNSSDTYVHLKQVLREEFMLSSRLILKLKNSNCIFLNEDVSYVNKKLSNGDKISVLIDFVETSNNIIPIKMDLDILYEDDYFLILNKPAGIPVHPSCNHFSDSLSNGVKYYFDSNSICKKIRPVNRLDRNTSGIVIFAKNEYIQELLISQMKNNKFKKQYIAVCNGLFANSSGIIDSPIARKPNSIMERCIATDGETAITIYKVIKEINNEFSELLINLQTRSNSSNTCAYGIYWSSNCWR